MKAALYTLVCAAWFCFGVGFGLGRGERKREHLEALIAVGTEDCRTFFDDSAKRTEEELQERLRDADTSL